MKNYTTLDRCRICGNPNLQLVLDLGEQALTGVFPKNRNQKITTGPVQLVKCVGSSDACGLLQMAHSYSLDEMYGSNYGYRSGLNASMVSHLHSKIKRILNYVDFSQNPLVLDIGSNDGTSLAAYPSIGCTRVGMDPTAMKFKEYYEDGIHVLPHFFSAEKFKEYFPDKKARVVTSFSMFYDLERPMDFVKEVRQILDSNGIWVFEQSYMPLMLERNSFDTACHEHLEYYSFTQIYYMLSRSGFKVLDLEFNDINGGSFSITAGLLDSQYPEWLGVSALLAKEEYLNEIKPFEEFESRVHRACEDLRKFVKKAKQDGKRVAALGASTKGNVLLQYCGFNSDDIFAVAEVNEEKFGSLTPGSLIPICPDSEVIPNADYLLVLPWHFKPFFVERYSAHLHKLVFPLPHLEVLTPQVVDHLSLNNQSD